MSNELGRSQLEPRLPDDPSYWQHLAARIVDSAEPVLREHRNVQAWWYPLAKWSPAIGVAAAAAVVGAVIVGPPAAPPAPITFEQVLGPDDPVDQAVVERADISSISTILLVQSGGQE